jgi:hypothetical protein
MTINDFTLRSTIERNQKFYLDRFGQYSAQWTDEWLTWAIQDYYLCKGSLDAFTEDDWEAIKENGLTKDEVEKLLAND